MQNKPVNGLIAAPFTPMDSKGGVKLETIGNYCRKLESDGLAGAFICGTTGEGPSLTTSERKMVLEEWVRISDDRLSIFAHVGGTSLNQSVELAGHAAETGAFAIASFAPFFYKPTSAGELISFFEPVAAAAPGLPFYYYHMPTITGVNIPVKSIIPLALERIPNFAGVKFTHADLFDLQESIKVAGEGVQLFSGYDEILLCGLSLGLKAAVGSTYNYMAPVYLEMIKSFNFNDMTRARELQYYSVKVVNILNSFGGAIRAGKSIMGMAGIDCGQCRLPISPIDDVEANELRKKLDEIDFFDMTKI